MAISRAASPCRRAARATLPLLIIRQIRARRTSLHISIGSVERIRATNPLAQEPLRGPDLVVYTCGNNTESMDVGKENDDVTSPTRIDVFLCDGSRRTVAEARVANVDNTRKAEFSYTAIDDSFPGKFEVANPSRYLEFMSTAYLAFVEFARCTEWEPISTSDDSVTNGTVPNGAFDLAAIFSRFQQSDFFDAINREVLEAGDVMDRKPRTRARN